MKSSRSMYSSRENGSCRVPAAGSSGLLTASTCSSRSFGIVLDHDLERPHDGQRAPRAAVQILADRVLEQRDVDDVLLLGDADALRRSRGWPPA